MESLISVIIPVYNSEKYLRQCVESVQRQTYQNLEIVLVNDGSTDSSPRICEQLSNEDARVRVVHKKNGGVGDTRNMGLSVANGDYIAFVDSDDQMEPNLLSALFELMNRTQADIAIGNFYEFIEDSQSYKVYLSEADYFEETFTPEQWLLKQYTGQFNISQCFTVPWCKLYKKELFTNVAYPTVKTAEDDFATWKVYLNASKIAFMNRALYMHRKRFDSVTKSVNLADVFPIATIEERIAVMTCLGMDVSQEIAAYKWRLNLHRNELLKNGSENLVRYKNAEWKLSVLEKYKNEE